MSIIDRNGDHHGNDGTYQERHRRDAGFALNPTGSLADQNAAWLEENGLHLSSDGIRLMTEELDGWPVNAIVRVDAFKKAFQQTNGYTYEEAEQASTAAAYLDLQGRADWAKAIRAVMGDPVTGEASAAHTAAPAPSYGGWENSNGDGSLGSPARHDDPRVQNGQVLDTIRDEDGVTTWHRRRDFIRPNDPSGIRFQATEQLTDDDCEHIRQILAYQYARTSHRDEIDVDIRRDSPYSFIVDVNRATNIVANWGPIEKYLPEAIEEGTYLRTTDRSGPGTAGTRAVQPFPRPIGFQLYYDSVDAGVNLMDGDIFDGDKIRQTRDQLTDLGYVTPTITGLNAMMSGQ